MKKLITLLGTTTLIVGAGTTAISCGKEKSLKKDKLNFQNFFNKLKVKVINPDFKNVEERLKTYINKQKEESKWKDYKIADKMLVEIFNPKEKPNQKIEELEKLDENEIIFTWWISNWETENSNSFRVVIEGFIGVKKDDNIKPKSLGYLAKPIIIVTKEELEKE